MANNDNSSAIWGLDTLQIQQNKVFVIGWIFIPKQQVQALTLQLISSQESRPGMIVLDSHQHRPDVGNDHPHHPEAIDSGFIGVGRWPRKPRLEDQLVLDVQLKTGQHITVEIPHGRWTSLISPSPWQQRKAAIRQTVRYMRKALKLLAHGQLASLQEKMRRQLSGSPQQPLSRPLTLKMLQELGASGDEAIRLIVDHRLGGGANHYRHQLVSEWLQRGDIVLTFTYYLARLEAMLIAETKQDQLRFSLASTDDIIPVLSTLRITSITYNTAVSFADAERLPALLLGLKEHHQASLVMLIHDYFCICPSHFLINADGKYCNIPSLARCQSCLPRNAHGFTSLFSGDVRGWRELWGPLLQRADQVIVFSKSSEILIRQAYESWQDGRNWLEGRVIHIEPHSVDYLKRGAIRINRPPTMIIGIVGHIGFHKGSRIIQRLAKQIENEYSLEKIIVIGNLEAHVNRQIVRQTGSYNRDRLAETIQASGANTFLLPSIWPETFSYVAQELMELDLPLACFNFGAPAERIMHYNKGAVLSSEEPVEILRELRQLFHATYYSVDHK